MPFYQRLGDVPRKRHVQFRDNGTLLTEEVMGLEGFSGNESILYHLTSPCRVQKLGDFEPIEREEWVPGRARAPALHDVGRRAGRRRGQRPPAPDVEQRRRDLALRPTERMDYFFRNGEGDEVIFVHEGTGTLETIFGDLPYKHGDYVVIPRGTTYRFAPDDGRAPAVLFETPGLIEIPKRYRNEYGQLLEHAPYYHRDIHAPTELKTIRERASSSSRCACATATRTTSSTTTRSTSSAGTATSTRGRSRSTTSSRSPGASTCRRRRTRRSRAGTS